LSQMKVSQEKPTYFWGFEKKTSSGGSKGERNAREMGIAHTAHSKKKKNK